LAFLHQHRAHAGGQRPEDEDEDGEAEQGAHRMERTVGAAGGGVKTFDKRRRRAFVGRSRA
jgi:hypothetical protein